MSKKPQKSGPASQRSSNTSGDSKTEQAAAAAAAAHQNGPADQRASPKTTARPKMTNENQEQPPQVRSAPATPPPPAPQPPRANLRPDRKRSRPSTVAQAQDKRVVKSEPGIDQLELTKPIPARQRQRLQTPVEQVSGAAHGRPAAGPPAGAVAQNVCAACAKPIRERFLLMALDKHWHEDCLKCAGCDCRLGEVGSSLFVHANQLFCRRDFLRIFGQNGHCAACKRSIPPYELVMRANEHAYHMECFACQQCQYRFCIGDRYHLTEVHKIICLPCHSEQQQQVHTGTQPQEHPNAHQESITANHSILSTTVSPADDDDDHRHHSPAPPTPPPPPPQEFAGETFGSEPEVIEPATRQQVAGSGSTTTTTRSSEPPSGQEFVELTNQRPGVGPPSKREPHGEGAGPLSPAVDRKRPPHLLAAAAVSTAATTAGQERACVM